VKPTINIHSTKRATLGDVKVFGKVLCGGEPFDTEVWLVVNGEEKCCLPRTRDGEYWFSLKLGTGFFRIQVELWKFWDEDKRIETKPTSDSISVLSFGGGLMDCKARQWVEKISLDRVWEKAKIASKKLLEIINPNKIYLVGRPLVRGWTAHDLDLKVVGSGLEDWDTEKAHEKLTTLNLLCSKEAEYPTDIAVGNRRVISNDEVYDLSGCEEVRSELWNDGFVSKPKPEVIKYEGQGGKLYEEGEELKPEELEAVRNGEFITRGEIE